jgi:hypothetical protein
MALFRIIVRGKHGVADDWDFGYSCKTRLEAEKQIHKSQQWNPWSELTIGRRYPEFSQSSVTCAMAKLRVGHGLIKRDTEMSGWEWTRAKPKVPPFLKKPKVYERYGII